VCGGTTARWSSTTFPYKARSSARDLLKRLASSVSGDVIRADCIDLPGHDFLNAVCFLSDLFQAFIDSRPEPWDLVRFSLLFVFVFGVLVEFGLINVTLYISMRARRQKRDEERTTYAIRLAISIDSLMSGATFPPKESMR
jgi:hypothetical protein